MDIHSLLNPDPVDPSPSPAETFAASPTPALSTSQSSAPAYNTATNSPNTFIVPQHFQRSNQTMPSTKKPDRGVQVRAQFGPKRPVNYPPIDVRNPAVHVHQYAAILAKLQEFEFTPVGENGEYERTEIPFAKRDNDLYAKTGREAFHVMKYEFTTRNCAEPGPWTAMWDYEVGLVRITPFFKAFKLGKTAPAKAINVTNRLRDVSFKITGGNIGGQGYWLPFECARQLCRTFCWPIKEALTPIFGFGFVDECYPETSSGFKNFRVDAAVVQRAIRQLNALKSRSTNSHGIVASTVAGSQSATGGPASMIGGKQLRPRKTKASVKVDSSSESDDDVDYDEEDHDEDEDEDDGKEVDDGDDDDDDDDDNDNDNGKGNGDDENTGDNNDEFNDAIEETFYSNPFSREDSPPLSPKSKPAPLRVSGWTSINQPTPKPHNPSTRKRAAAVATASPPSFPRSHASPTRPSTAPKSSQNIKNFEGGSFRPPLSRGKKRAIEAPARAATTLNATSAAAATAAETTRLARSPSHSESDDEDIPLPLPRASKRRAVGRAASSSPSSPSPRTTEGLTAGELGVDEETLEAARLLIALSRDARTFGIGALQQARR